MTAHLIFFAMVGLSQHCLSRDEIARYARQLVIPSFGPSAQCLLLSSSVLVIGAGGLGSPVLLYLAAAGVGSLGVIGTYFFLSYALLDDDLVEESNLQRQIIHSFATLQQPKATSAASGVKGINPFVSVTAYHERLEATNAATIIGGYSLVLDASDNPATRYLVNDACVLAGIPLVSASALRLDGQISTFGLDGGPCYRCVFPIVPENVVNCSDGGILGVCCDLLLIYRRSLV